MGNQPPIMDERVERIADIFLLTNKDIKKFWTRFQRYDIEDEGVISIDDFFRYILRTERSIFGDSLFDLVETETPEEITFSEFLHAILTFCMFEVNDILKFCFFIIDKDKNGFVEQSEFEVFLKTLHTQSGAWGKVQKLINEFDNQDEGQFSFHDFERLHHRFPQILYPIFKLQQSMMNTILGQMWWRKKKYQITLKKEKENKHESIREKNQRKAERIGNDIDKILVKHDTTPSCFEKMCSCLLSDIDDEDDELI